MSAPNNQAIEAENLKYGFLAARAEEALRKKLSDAALSRDDLRILAEAHAFLRTLAQGAELVETGVYRGHNSRESIRALGLAMDPLKQLESLQIRPELAAYLESLSAAIDPAKISTRAYDPARVADAERFFQSLYDFLSTAIGRNRQKKNVNLRNRVSTGS